LIDPSILDAALLTSMLPTGEAPLLRNVRRKRARRRYFKSKDPSGSKEVTIRIPASVHQDLGAMSEFYNSSRHYLMVSMVVAGVAALKAKAGRALLS
jgi:hypothetical protein